MPERWRKVAPQGGHIVVPLDSGLPILIPSKIKVEGEEGYGSTFPAVLFDILRRGQSTCLRRRRLAPELRRELTGAKPVLFGPGIQQHAQSRRVALWKSRRTLGS